MAKGIKLHDQLVSEEFHRREPEKYKIKKIEWGYSVVTLLLWVALYFNLFFDLKTGQFRKLDLLYTLILALLLFVFVVVVVAKSLEQEWGRRFLTKEAIAKSKAEFYNLPIQELGTQSYDFRYVYTDNRPVYIFYKIARYIFYGTTYLLFAVIIAAEIAVAFAPLS